jgi:hypothetical protein
MAILNNFMIPVMSKNLKTSNYHIDKRILSHHIKIELLSFLKVYINSALPCSFKQHTLKGNCDEN